MLSWSLMFFILSLVAAFFGFTDVALASAGMAKVIFYVFVALFVLSLVSGLVGFGGGR